MRHLKSEAKRAKDRTYHEDEEKLLRREEVFDRLIGAALRLRQDDKVREERERLRCSKTPRARGVECLLLLVDFMKNLPNS
jgi:hypothetical protein